MDFLKDPAEIPQPLNVGSTSPRSCGVRACRILGPPGSPSGPAGAGGAEHPLSKGPQAGRGPADPQDGKPLRREASRGAAASRARNFSYGGIGAVESDVSYNRADDEF